MSEQDTRSIAKESSRLWRLMMTQLWVSVFLAMILSFDASSNGISHWNEYTHFQQAKVVITAIAAGLLVVKAFYSDAVSEYKKSKEKSIAAIMETETPP